MLPVVSISTVCSGLPIFDLFGLREPLHAHVQVSDAQPVFSLDFPLLMCRLPFSVPSLQDRGVIS